MPELSFAAAFAGGVLSILSPCSALLLPAFFAVALTSRTRLLARALLFYAGLVTLLVPVGLGVAFVVGVVFGARDVLIMLTGALLIAFGALTLLGRGFAIAPAASARLASVEGRFAAYATGLAYGFAGFCSGPILGAVLTVAATSGQALTGAALLATYSLGMTLPVFALAAAWDRWRIGERSWLRERTVRIGGGAVPVTPLLAGGLFVALGAGFIVFQGSSALGGLYASLGLADLSQEIETRLRGIGN